MILTCPECKTRYLVNPAQLRPSGRVVRCAKCGAAWKEEAPAPEPSEVQSQTDEPPREDLSAPPPYERPVRVRPLPRGSNLPAIQKPKKNHEILGWISLVAFVSLVLGSGYFWRSRIVVEWPPSRKLYDILAIDTRPAIAAPPKAQSETKPKATASKDLQFKNLNAAPRYDGNILVLTFTGTIENPTEDAILPTRITAMAKDEKGADIKSWSFSVNPGAIAAHGSEPFSTELRDAPAETRRIVPVFVPNP